MKQVFQQQYELAQRARGIVFEFLGSRVGRDLNTPVPAFDDKTIRDLLMHTAYCYHNWLAAFAMQKPLMSGKFGDSIEHIIQLYGHVDNTMDTFLQVFEGKMDSPITGTHDAMGRLTASPLFVFTHVLTHEFHHKGQIMSMCRLLGYPPPDTDVSNFFVSA